MASTTAIKRRIRSVKSTRQITKAMELVSASKMRRATDASSRSRAYRNMAVELLTRLRNEIPVERHPLFVIRPVRARLLVVMASDRGLAGAYNSNVYRRLVTELTDDAAQHTETKIITIGRQAGKFLARLEGAEFIAAYESFEDQPTAVALRPLLDQIVELYQTGAVDAVDLLFTDYKSSVLQEVTTQRLLPAAFTDRRVSEVTQTALIEPGPKQLLAEVAERFVEVQLWQAVLEAQASEHSRRMLAMKTASDNASELVDDLTLAANTARQAAITQELAEITGGAEAMV